MHALRDEAGMSWGQIAHEIGLVADTPGRAPEILQRAAMGRPNRDIYQGVQKLYREKQREREKQERAKPKPPVVTNANKHRLLLEWIGDNPGESKHAVSKAIEGVGLSTFQDLLESQAVVMVRHGQGRGSRTQVYLAEDDPRRTGRTAPAANGTSDSGAAPVKNGTNGNGAHPPAGALQLQGIQDRLRSAADDLLDLADDAQEGLPKPLRAMAREWFEDVTLRIQALADELDP
jgi:hypothetical protein